MKLRQMTREGAQAFLEAKEFCPEFHPLFLMALRAGLRKGELLAVRWGDIQFGIGDSDPNRYIVVQRNYVTVVSRLLRARNRVGPTCHESCAPFYWN